MKLLKFIGALLYGAIIYYLLWLLFNWMTPYVMNISWGWFIAYILIAGGLVSILVGQVVTWLAIPMVFLVKGCKAAKYPQILFGLFFGYSSLKLIWALYADYGLLQWILAISLTIIILISYISLMVVPFNMKEE